jgi:hypothetical protein
MEQNSELEKQTPTTKRKMSPFLKAFLWTAIPILVLTVIGMPGALAPYTAWVGFGVFGGAAGVLWVLTILAYIGFAIAGKSKIALGLLAGVVVGLVCVAVYVIITLYNQPPP